MQELKWECVSYDKEGNPVLERPLEIHSECTVTPSGDGDMSITFPDIPQKYRVDITPI